MVKEMMIMNKRGWLRILEASIAIILILSVLVFIFQQKNTVQQNDFAEDIPALLEEVANNDALRTAIVNTDYNSISSVEQEIENFLSTKINNPGVDYAVRVCLISDDLCPLIPWPTTIDNEVYTKERIISSTLAKIEPRKVKIFLWRKV